MQQFSRRTLAYILVTIGSVWALLVAALVPGTGTSVEGLWRYRTLGRDGGAAVALDGLFLISKGRFVQQSLNEGEPYDRQLAQAHAGTYRTDGDTLHLDAEVGIIVDPTKTPAVTSRDHTQHVVKPVRAGQALTLTFGTGTVQMFQRVGSGDGELIVLDRGALALVDGHFVLVAEVGDRRVAGSGSFDRSRRQVQLHADRWLAIDRGEAHYGRAQTVEATLDPDIVTLSMDPALRIPVRR